MSQSVESLRKELEQRSSEELMSILRNRDEEEWRPEVFEVVSLVLKDRGISPEEVIALGLIRFCRQFVYADSCAFRCSTPRCHGRERSSSPAPRSALGLEAKCRKDLIEALALLCSERARAWQR